LILQHLCVNPIRILAPNSRNPNLVPVGSGFGFLLYLDYPDFYTSNLEKVIAIIAPVIEDSIRNEVPSFNVQVADKLPLEKAMQSHCF